VNTSESHAPKGVLDALAAAEGADRQALYDLIRIPSISTDPASAAEVRRAAVYLADQLRAAGPFVVEIHETPRHPIVTAAWHGAPGAPTVLIYGHYDVQPPDPLERWTTPPFEPHERDGRVYARGASDDKSPLFIPIGVAAAYFRSEGGLPVNVLFVLEGEEEIGSPSLEPFVQGLREHLACDLVISADGGMWRADHPSTMVSTRGMLKLAFSLHGAAKDLHSGRHGGGIANPLHALARLVASLHDDEGRVAVAGFYDDVEAIPERWRASLADLPFEDADYLKEIGAAATFGEPGYSTLERQWYRPTLEVNGMWGGYQGAGSKTVLPSEAHAKVTCRLVAGQDPARIAAAITRHLERHTPPGVRLELEPGSEGSRAYRLRADHPGLQAVVAALRAEYRREPWVIGMGGSVPICEAFQRHLGADTVFFSFAVGDEDIHAPNEFFRLPRFGEGRRAWADLLSRLPDALRQETDDPT
jgi:acetylornithine deacetylase/succinyl-diaminopimelate desuccinylase-like protein